MSFAAGDIGKLSVLCSKTEDGKGEGAGQECRVSLDSVTDTEE